MEYRLPFVIHLAQGVQKMITKTECKNKSLMHNNKHRSKESEKENYRLMPIQDKVPPPLMIAKNKSNHICL